MVPSSAVIVIAHGSPDPDWRAPIERLGDRLRSLLNNPDVLIRVGYLERSPPSLDEIAAELEDLGIGQATVVPAFLSPGGRHIKHDLPTLVERVAARTPGIAWTLLPGALGDDAGVIDALAQSTLRRLRTP